MIKYSVSMSPKFVLLLGCLCNVVPVIILFGVTACLMDWTSGVKSDLCCVFYELQMYSGGEQRKPVHCVHPQHWTPVLDNNVRVVLDVHSGQAFFALLDPDPH
jgi:hypothetical protein